MVSLYKGNEEINYKKIHLVLIEGRENESCLSDSERMK